MYQQYFVLVLLLPSVNTELFTSVSHLYSSTKAGSDLATMLKNNSRAYKDLKTISDKMEQQCLKAQKDPYRYIANPIGAFLFVKTFTLDWDRDVQPILEENILSETDLRKLKDIREYLPSYTDLKGVAAALFRLQDTYKLSAKRLAEGFINERYIHRLSAEDCYDLGRLAFEMKQYHNLNIWMDISLKKERIQKIHNVSRIELFDYAIHGRELVGQIKQALILTNEQLMLDPGLQSALNRKEKYLNILRRTKRWRNVDTESEKVGTFEALCRGEKVIQLRHRDRLQYRCYSNNNHPLLVLRPIKEEILHISPKIVLYHDVISDVEIEEIKSASMPLLDTSRIVSSEQITSSNSRISKSSFLAVSDTEADLKIRKRIEAITGLSMEDSEPLHVANYGIAGHFSSHVDYLDKTEADNLLSENIIATWLNYMSDVEGGATVFEHLSLRILPKKGAALFWYNLYQNGLPNEMTVHGACPVLIGSKWISTYWIGEKKQVFKRPCSINPKE